MEINDLLKEDRVEWELADRFFDEFINGEAIRYIITTSIKLSQYDSTLQKVTEKSLVDLYENYDELRRMIKKLIARKIFEYDQLFFASNKMTEAFQKQIDNLIFNWSETNAGILNNDRD